MTDFIQGRNRKMSCSTVRKSSYVFEYRITFLGAEKVGKSAIINQFTRHEFIEDYAPTAENHLTHVVEHDGDLCVCLLVDTAGNDDFPAMRKLSITKGNAFIVVYSIDDRKTYQRAKSFIQDIKSLKQNSTEIKIVLVGNKFDVDEKKREVTYEEGLTYSGSLHEGNVITSFIETSSKEYDSVTEIFHKILTMFSPPPPQIEIPILQRRKSLPRKIRSFTRKTSRNLSERKLSATKVKTNLKESLSDSEVNIKTSPLSPILFVRRFRKRADSNPVVETPYDIWGSPIPTTGPRFLRKIVSLQTVGSITEISTPTLISHSATLNRYKMGKPRSFSLNSNSSSDDSGVCDDCHSPELSSKVNDFSRRRSLMGLRTNLRRKSINEKMRGIFRRTKSLVF